MIDDDSRQTLEQLLVSIADRADAVEGAAVGHDEEVVVGVRIRVGPGSFDVRHEVVDRGDRIGEHRRRPPAVVLDEPADREGRAEGVGVGAAAGAAVSGVGVGRPGRWAKDKDVTSNSMQTKANDRRNLCTAKTPLRWIIC